jgi:CheY-like chemotaxis protein
MSRALVVDDKEENCEFLSALLRGHGYQVVAAKHGAEALALARQQPTDNTICSCRSWTDTPCFVTGGSTSG